MKTALTQPPTNFKPQEEPESPYFRGRKEWDDRMGGLVIQAKNWRFAFLAVSLLSFVLGASLFIQIRQHTVIPILIGLDKTRGEPTVLGPVDPTKMNVGTLEVKYFLTEFIRFVRAVPLDQVVIKQNWLRAYAYLRKDASELLNDLTNRDPDSPLKQIGKVIVSVQPLSVVEIPGTGSYQARWKEVVYSAQGTKLNEYTMLGTFMIEFDPPSNQQMIQENPLGIYIRNFQWNREL